MSDGLLIVATIGFLCAVVALILSAWLVINSTDRRSR